MKLPLDLDVPDLAAAEAFYTAAFDLVVGRRLDRGGVIELLGAQAPFHLLDKRAGGVGAGDSARERRPLHCDVVVGRLEPALERALAAGARRTGEIGETDSGRIAQLTDPFGHGWRLIESGRCGDAAAAGATDFAQGLLEIVGPDLERALAFYRALDFELLRRTGPFAVVHFRGQRLLLAEHRDAPTDERWASLRIVVDDVDAIHARVLARGLQPSGAIGDRAYGLRDFVVTDPSGFGIRFAQALPA